MIGLWAFVVAVSIHTQSNFMQTFHGGKRDGEV